MKVYLKEDGDQPGCRPQRCWAHHRRPSLLHVWTATSQAGATPLLSTPWVRGHGSPTSYEVISRESWAVLPGESNRQICRGDCGQGQCRKALEGLPGLHSYYRRPRLHRCLVTPPTP